MGKPIYAVLAAHYPKKPRTPSDGGMDAAALYRSIGHSEYVENMYMQNTCAVRVSLALLGAGIQPFPGHMTVKAGKFKGKRIEQSQQRLSDFLQKRLGPPEVYPSGYEASRKIGSRRRIVSFFRLNGSWDPQGYIDLVEPATAGGLKCMGTCYFSAQEVWFWPLQ
ncbi:T6SS effector amidase Tae4 family protein [Massilia sp. LXY-6]|uniref:T6SS effector amidase Tae4 family protein n=1 Tax=Massilia sp. LXY-6 TaxID=3379823 RepID=UPI003EE3B890